MRSSASFGIPSPSSVTSRTALSPSSDRRVRDRDPARAVRPRGLRPVHHQVEDHLLHLRGVAGQGGSASSSRSSASTFSSFSLWETRPTVVRTIGARSAGRALGLRAAREGQEVGHDAARARRLLAHPLEVAAELRDPLPGDPVLLQDPAHEGGVVEDAGERVVDLVGDARRELAEGGQAVGLEQAPLGLLELGGALGHLRLQLLGRPVDLGQGLAQAVPHLVEGAGQAPQLEARGDLDRVLEVHAAERGVGLDQPVDGAGHEEPDEGHEEGRDERDLDRGGDDHPPPRRRRSGGPPAPGRARRRAPRARSAAPGGRGRRRCCTRARCRSG